MAMLWQSPAYLHGGFPQSWTSPCGICGTGAGSTFSLVNVMPPTAIHAHCYFISDYDRYVFVRFGVHKWYCWGIRCGMQCCFTELIVFMLHGNVVPLCDCLTLQVNALHSFKAPWNSNTASHPRRQLWNNEMVVTRTAIWNMLFNTQDFPFIKLLTQAIMYFQKTF